MVIELHLCGPIGDGQRQELDAALALLQMDNEFLIQAMLSAGLHVPDTVDEMGLVWVPPSKLEAQTDRQRFFHMRDMLERRRFSCGDAAGYEAAVQRAKYGVPARAFTVDVVPDWMRKTQGDAAEGLWHSVYSTPSGIVDPVGRHLRRRGRPNAVWEALT